MGAMEWDIDLGYNATMDAIERFIRQRLQEREQRIEEACEKALQEGKHGVLVIDRADGDIDAIVSPDVPYFEIHYIPMVGFMAGHRFMLQ